MKSFKVKKIFRTIEKGEFIKPGTVFAVGEDGIYIYTFWKNVPELHEAAIAVWPKKDKEGNIELFRDYWKYYVDDKDSKHYGKQYTEIFTLVTETLSQP